MQQLYVQDRIFVLHYRSKLMFGVEEGKAIYSDVHVKKTPKVFAAYAI
jgi:hypothetical protein